MSKKSYLHRLVARFRGSRFLSSLLYKTGNDLKDKKWIFILGCYNSGTTLLEEMLSHHESISGLGDEGVMLTDKLPRPEDFGWKRMWWKCEEMMRPFDDKATATRIKRHWSHFLDTRKSYFLEKSIANSARILFFQKHFRPAYFIHIVRNGYAVAEGIRRKASIASQNPLSSSMKNYPIELCAMQWRRTLEVIHAQMGDLDSFIEVRYEDLTKDPDRTMGRIFSFLGIKGVYGSFKNVQFSVHKTDDLVRNMNEQSIRRLSADDRKLINEVATDYLIKYDYYIGEK